MPLRVPSLKSPGVSECAHGRRVLVTGAASGIGEGIARRPLADGDEVMGVNATAAALAAFLLSDDTSYITGQAIAVDRGYTMV